ncbi:class I SAM-dependent methyltransferase [Polaribacter dokdonensis]|uniref:Methyltransferase n=1 Tax=Polaribacter dokdonensis DSW-5 TaxID=1300348 RepID=A0A0M9CEN6_9FLAO|nr:class I SAM-dependent methyltransferase [Polaribacter dokdonensis]KOY50856.1 Methyltransferase [Polaribacter dokdonensis DSW-5]SEE24384.1 Methyltransferase domain-containing protein [Polaribacter dokdonensis DSW-5]
MQNLKKDKKKKPWPTKKVMEQIYDQNLWGGNKDEIYSGSGSHNPKIVQPYLEVVINFLKSFQEPIIVLDLGCGDFNVGRQLLAFSNKIIAVDIAENVINYNKAKYANNSLEFQCLDISKDDLPRADVVILRQVLQHVSNKEVHSVLNKLKEYKYVILTEHLPNQEFVPNKDIISGQGIRIKNQSGLIITKEPFNFKYKKQQELESTILDNNKGVIKTWLFTL